VYHNKRHKRRDRNHSDYRALQVDVHYTGDSEEQRTADLEKAISKFKKLVMKEGILQEIKDREYFRSPGQKRYEKHKKFLYKLSRKKEKAQKRYQKDKDK
jgi:small subunit ribosomal protein S21